MKKIIITINLILATLLISGCGCSKKELKTVTCSLKRDDYEVDFIFKGDDNKLVYYERNEKILNYDSSLKENYQSFFDFMKNWDDSIDEYDFEYEINDDYILGNLKIDFLKVNAEDVLGAPGLYSKYYDYENKYFDMEKAVDVYMNDSGYSGLICG